MVNNTDSRNRDIGRFRWIPRAILLLAGLMPALYMLFYFVVMKELGPKYWEWGQFIVSLFLMIVPFLSITCPFIGGIIGILVTPVILFGYALMAGMAGLSDETELFLSITTMLFIIGGILSIIVGIRNWQRRRGKLE